VSYPNITRAVALDSVGTGWAPIINRVYDAIEQEHLAVEVHTVKEKFGVLRVYGYGTDYERLHAIVQTAMRDSAHTCEDCGAAGETGYTACGYIRTLCKPCLERYDAAHPDY
jgi:hypothetical protein